MKNIESVQITAIILLILSLLSISNSILAIPAIILSIISIVFSSNAKSLINTDLELSKSKANTASTLNIIAISLLIAGFILVFGLLAILNSITQSMLN